MAHPVRRSPLARRLPRPLAAVLGVALIAALVPAPVAAVVAPGPLTDGGATTASAPGTSTIALQAIATGLSKPVFITSSLDGTSRLFIVEKTGKIRIRKSTGVLSTPFLDISSLVSTGGEQGLLGLAFHPSYATNRRFFVDYTDRNGDTVIREYRASATNPDRADTSTARTLLRIAQPYANHNGGMIAFGPDKLLYIGTGDGGSAGDPGNRAQSLSSLLGKVLRINVNGTTGTKQYAIPSANPYVGRTGLDEIWQRGLRNPWRFSFDRSTGALWIGDVGQGRWEEVDRALVTSTGAGRGANWGWRVMEGFHCYSPSTGCSTSGKRLPQLEYSHASGRCAVTGGYVYRGSRIPALKGWYVFADYCTGEIWATAAGAASPASKVLILPGGAGRLVSSFGQDGSGELYLVDLGGTVSKIVPK